MLSIILTISLTILTVVQNGPKLEQKSSKQEQTTTEKANTDSIPQHLETELITAPKEEMPGDLKSPPLEPINEVPVPVEKIAEVDHKNYIIGGLLLGFGSLLFFGRRLRQKLNLEMQQLVQKNEEAEKRNIELKQEIEKVKSAALENQSSILDKNIVIPGKEKKVIRIGDILYVQSQKNAIKIHTKSEKFWVWQTLNKFYSTLPGDEFCRTQRSYIVNLNEISSYSKTAITLKNNVEVKIGDAYRVELFKKLTAKMTEN